MKIALITYQFPPSIGGMQQWNRQMAECYATLGHLVTVFHLRYGTRSPAVSLYSYVPVTVDKKANAETCSQPRNTLPVLLKTLFFFFRHTVALARHDVWQVTFGELMAARLTACLLARLFRKTLIAVSGCVVFNQPYPNQLYRWIALALSRTVLRTAHLILVDGEDLKREFVENKIDASRIRVCYAAVDTAMFFPARSESRFRHWAQQRNIHLLADCPTILFCSRFSFENNPLDFLKAVEMLDGMQALMIGAGPMDEVLRRKARLIRTPVHFAGTVTYDQLPQIFSSVNVCLYPFSRYIGGISQVVPLSMACGAAVVTTDIGDNRALIENGVNGFLVREGDCAAMAQCVADIIFGRIDAASIGSAARKTIVERWSIEKRRQQYRLFLEELDSAIYSPSNCSSM